MTIHEEIRDAYQRGEIWPAGIVRGAYRPWYSRIWHCLTGWFTGDDL